MKNLFLFLVTAFVLALACSARADGDTCSRALAMVEELHDAQVDLSDMKELAAQVCAEPALKKECARQRIEIRAFEAEIRELETETLAALRSCNGQRNVRKANQ